MLLQAFDLVAFPDVTQAIAICHVLLLPHLDLALYLSTKQWRLHVGHPVPFSIRSSSWCAVFGT